jgi:hypothetical protein
MFESGSLRIIYLDGKSLIDLLFQRLAVELMTWKRALQYMEKRRVRYRCMRLISAGPAGIVPAKKKVQPPLDAGKL